jgi:O-6-methylguanine DNA methyltransferase
VKSAPLRCSTVETALGRLFVATSERGLCSLALTETGARERLERWAVRHVPGAPIVEDSAALAPAARQLQEYGRGERRVFELELDLCGSEFELRVWNALRAIPWGKTRTYGEIAQAIGAPGSARAVGRANGRNPLPIVVPCHRVLSGTGLGGFSGGLEWKQRLLALERVQLFA